MTRAVSRSTLELPWALDPEHEDRWLRVARHRGVVFLDYDGTLTPIVDRPEYAILSDAMRSTVRRLSSQLTVAIVSGRDIEVVAGLVGLHDLTYVGSHGLDIAGPPGSGLRRELGLDFLEALDAAERELRRGTGGIDGVVVERKRFSVSTHVRLVVSDRRPAVEAVVDAVQRAYPSLRREGGKMLYELRPDMEWDKGRAVDWLLHAMERASTESLFIGDDLTDETVFRALAGEGTGIVVADRDRPTAADLRLDRVEEVRALLDRLTAAL
jgi:alpha,alpha-trehalase